jgi:CDP-diacylglycerol--serine O-phosphatidyltransferase
MFFQWKDAVTLCNAAAGFASMILCVEGHLVWASAAIMIGYFFDAIDGTVARLLGAGPTRFGGELDNTCDLVTYSVAPGVLVFVTYRDRIGFWPAAVLGSLPVLTGVVRFARFNIKRIEYPGIWFGMPRPASALATVFFLRSHLFQNVPGADMAGVVLIPALAIWNLGLYPFVGHHNRNWRRWVAFLLFGVVLGSLVAAIPISLFMDVVVFWDIGLIWMVLYPVAQWTLISPEERRRIRKFVEDWRAT